MKYSDALNRFIRLIVVLFHEKKTQFSALSFFRAFNLSLTLSHLLSFIRSTVIFVFFFCHGRATYIYYFSLINNHETV